MVGAHHQPAVKIRPAVFEDADGITHAFLESAEYHVQLDPDRYLIPAAGLIVAHYQTTLQQSANEAVTLVAEVNREIVGFIDARLEQSPDLMHQPISFCHIAEIAVRSAYRSQGVGSQLLQAAKDWGRHAGAEFSSLEHHVDNTSASSFYRERMGYCPASSTLIKRLQPDRS